MGKTIQQGPFFMRLPVDQEKKRCPHSPGVFVGARLQGDKILGLVAPIACKSWECPVCSTRKKQIIRRRAFRGPIMAAANVPGFRPQFLQKFLTLTCPGDDYRRTHTAEQALDDMNKFWNRLRTAITKHFGKFMYFKVLERQRDGYPHFHILMVGRAIAPKGLLRYIEILWRETYKMGFVRLNVITNDIKHGIRYATKYLLQADKKNDYQGRLNIRRYARLFTASRGALEPMEKSVWDIENKVIFGATSETGECEEIEIPALAIPAHVRRGLVPDLRRRVCHDEGRIKKALNNKIKGGFRRCV